MKRVNRFYFAAVIAGVICMGLMFGANAFAVDKNACSEDVSKFCADVKPGQGAIVDCLGKHESELSAPCKDLESKRKERRADRKEVVRSRIETHQACKDDVAKFCKDVQPGRGAIPKCLKEHESELSAQCSQKMKAIKKTD
jgi:hypothetical protein